MVNKGLYQLNKQCQTRLKEAATIPPSYGPAGVIQRGGARRHAFTLLFLRSIIRSGLRTAFVHNDAAYALPTTPIEVLTRCFFRWIGYPVPLAHTPKHGLSCHLAALFPSLHSILAPSPGAVGARALLRRVGPAVSLW